ncbi:MAG TPA: gamma-glutamyltransferase [Acidimicrobiales bacterium]|nr:gamma-glutamyltransferase [Acidimicrobiales bacterium]
MSTATPTHSSTVVAPHGLVCSVDHLASSAGVAILRAGGSAADAAVATSAVLAVTTPHMCGMGGDLWALVHTGTGAPDALCAAGRAGSGADPDQMLAEGLDRMPLRGDVRSAPVPGCVDGWLTLHERHGELPLADVLAPAIGYADDGFPASPQLAGAVRVLAGVAGAEDLVPARAGHRLRRPGVAAALRAVVADGRDGFYLGAFGAGLLELGAGEYVEDDLRRTQADWVTPVARRVWGHDVWTVPAPSQGYLTLAAAVIADGLGLGGVDDDARAHLLVEAARAAGADRPDVRHDGADPEALLAADRLDALRAGIDPERRGSRGAASRPGGTIHLVVADARGGGVSLIQSNASGFGSHVFEPTTGIGLHDRGIGFSLAAGHPARYGPGRRPPSTLSPALVTRPDGSLRGVLGTMGGDSQPQVLLQLLVRWLVDGDAPGRALAAPRWVLEAPESNGFDTWDDPDTQVVRVEDHAPPSWGPGLTRRGHPVRIERWDAANFGHAHIAEVVDGVVRGAADPRARTGAATGW